MTVKESFTIGRYGLGVGVVSLEEVCHCRDGLTGFVYAEAMSSEKDHFLFPVNQDVRISTPSLSPCLPAHCPNDNGLNL